MFHIHKWSPWSEEPVRHAYSGRIIAVQLRRCKKCNLVKRKNL